MANHRDYIVDFSNGRTSPRPDPTDSNRRHRNQRNWISMFWRCCSVYSRVYKTRDGRAYRGHCPKCAKPVHVRIGPGGTDHRMFEAW